jgi:hypothetical protein
MGKKDAMQVVKPTALAIFTFLISLCFAAPSFPFTRADTLRGLEGIEVLVEEFKPEAEDFITVIQVQSDVESKLRHAGIRILTKEENEKMQPLRKPYLYIKLTSYKPPTRRDVLPFNVEVSLKQKVRLECHSESSDKSFYSATWAKSSVSVVSFRNPSEIRDVINELTDLFIKAYLKASGKTK